MTTEAFDLRKLKPKLWKRYCLSKADRDYSYIYTAFKDTASLVLKQQNVLRPCHHYQNFNFTNSRRPWPPNSISHLFFRGIPAFFSSWPLLSTFFTPGVFWLRFIIYEKILLVHLETWRILHFETLIKFHLPLGCPRIKTVQIINFCNSMINLWINSVINQAIICE